ncbi:50S ribosomal protein L24 [Calidifontibacter sp. DB0510]|uniref:Large ribosomal subunit protein uL24 n=2 Tax=Metallococcus carri TaxID=1656884 RepID=A0A967EGK0_9MICO|nr:50S ribosomal protein L24 [Metallococcus carri]NOP36250.1 50S ribosomal protein L24 [Calidifontibacter sp. DB2511S]
MKIKKNDLVQVISGPDKGKQGKVIGVKTETQRVTVEGVNRVTKHLRAGQPGQASGGIQVVEAPIHVSNVMIVDPETNQPTRIRTRVEQVERDGKTKTVRTRVSVRSGKDF